MDDDMIGMDAPGVNEVSLAVTRHGYIIAARLDATLPGQTFEQLLGRFIMAERYIRANKDIMLNPDAVLDEDESDPNLDVNSEG